MEFLSKKGLKKFCTSLHKELLKRRQEQTQYDWHQLARLNQLPPEGDWFTWIIMAGRGFGKTRTGAETIRMWVKTGQFRHLALVGNSFGEARQVMIEGPSGLLAVHPSRERPKFEASKRRLIWPNGATATLFSAESPEQLRGPQFDGAWIDELAKFRHPEETWNQLLLGLRLGNQPRCIVTTTPRPTPFLEKLICLNSTHLTKGTTFDNQANLAPAYLKQINQQFGGTSLGTQELYGELLMERNGALWQRQNIRYQQPPQADNGTWNLERIVVAIDPATTHHAQSDETGIVVAGLDAAKNAYILEDLTGRHSPHEWAQKAVDAYWRYKADRVVAEVNKGGDLVERILKAIDPHIAYKAVRATRGKITRAEPIAALYEQGRVFHSHPFKHLEEQLCDYTGHDAQKSPDRLDAAVWALTELLLEAESKPMLKVWMSDGN